MSFSSSRYRSLHLLLLLYSVLCLSFLPFFPLCPFPLSLFLPVALYISAVPLSLFPFPFSSSCFGPIVSRRSDRWYANSQHCAWPTKYKLTPYYTGCANKGGGGTENGKNVAGGREGRREAHRWSSRSFESTNATIKDPLPLRCRCCYRCFCNADPNLCHPCLRLYIHSASVLRYLCLCLLVSYSRMPKDNPGTRFPIPNIRTSHSRRTRRTFTDSSRQVFYRLFPRFVLWAFVGSSVLLISTNSSITTHFLVSHITWPHRRFFRIVCPFWTSTNLFLIKLLGGLSSLTVQTK